MGLALADHVADGRSGHQHLGCRHATFAVLGLGQGLTHHTLQCTSELNANLLLLVRREDVDDAVNGLGRVLGVQRGKYKVARFGRGQRNRDRFKVAQLPHHDDVGVLTQSVFERIGKAVSVFTHFTLVHDAPLVSVQELNRVFYGQDVIATIAVSQVNQGCQRRRLT